MTDIENDVMAVVDKIGDPLMSDIVAGVEAHREAVKEAVNSLTVRGWLRQKEDPVDHDWAYWRGRPNPSDDPAWVHPHDCGYVMTGSVKNCDCIDRM